MPVSLVAEHKLMLEAAKRLIKAGFSVHRLHPKEKRPIGNDWASKPVLSFEALQSAYRTGENLGVRLGKWSKVGGGYLFVIDLDVRDPARADEARRKLDEILPGWKSFPRVVSGSGGSSRHVYLIADRPFTSKKLAHSEEKIVGSDGKKHWAWEIELFGTGKQVVLPPSIHPDTGKPYRWEERFDLENLALGIGPFVKAEVLERLIGRRTTETNDIEGPEPLNLDDDEVKRVLADLPHDQHCEDRDGWLTVGMALHHQYQGARRGFEIWCEFSKRSTKFDLKNSREVWRSFKSSKRGKPVTMATLVNAAREARLENEEYEDLGDEPNEEASTIVGHNGDMFDDLLGSESEISSNETIPKALEQTQIAAAATFVDRHGNNLRFDHTAGCWYIWNDKIWKKDDTKLAVNWCKSLCRELFLANPKKKDAKKLTTKGVIEAVEGLARSDRKVAVTSEIWDTDQWLLGTPNGTADLRAGVLREARREDFITRLTAVAPIPLDRFDAARDCPTWIKFLHFALDGDKSAIRFLRQWLSYCLTGDTREQALLFVYGPGGAGKGTAINGFAKIMGDYALNVDMSTLTQQKNEGHSTQFARLKGARLAYASETEEGKAWAENRIKTLTGGDKVTARFMARDNFEFVPEFKLTIFGNNRPAIQNVDEAIRRRFNVLPFTHIPNSDEKDLELGEKLKAEAMGILSWAIQGCLDWQKNGLVRPACVLEATESYFVEQDTFGLWLEAECEIGKDYADTNDNLWHSWALYARNVGESAGSRNKTFPEAMGRRGFREIIHTMGIRGRGRAGIRVRPERDEFDNLDDIGA